MLYYIDNKVTQLVIIVELNNLDMSLANMNL